jgi:hypothetical protein
MRPLELGVAFRASQIDSTTAVGLQYEGHHHVSTHDFAENVEDYGVFTHLCSRQAELAPSQVR